MFKIAIGTKGLQPEPKYDRHICFSPKLKDYFIQGVRKQYPIPNVIMVTSLLIHTKGAKLSIYVP